MMKLIDIVLFLVISFAATAKANPLAGGKQVESAHLYPFMATLMYKRESFCGGSIISNRYILTAAHCLVQFKKDFDQVKVAVGTINWMDVPEGRLYNSEAWITHKKFPNKKICNYAINDIALIRVDRDIDFSTNEVQPISLDLTNLRISNSVLLLGFGPKGRDCKETYYLHKLNSYIEPSSKDRFERMLPDKPGIMMNKVYCTKGTGTLLSNDRHERFASCPGDSGGPVVFKDPETNKWIQVGVIAYSTGDLLETRSVKVFDFLDWIDQAKSKLVFKRLTTNG